MNLPARFLFYSHDSYGLGHLRRTLLVAEAVTAANPGASVVCLTGSPVPEMFQLPPRCELIKMPVITKDGSGNYAPRNLPLRLREVLALRSAIISATVRAFLPEVMLVDHAVTGLGGELLPVLRQLRCEAPGTRLVLGLRDILDAPDRARAELGEREVAMALQQAYDQILVYGDAAILDVVGEYGLAPAVQRKITYVGAVCPRVAGIPARRQGQGGPTRLVVGTGGGGDGHDLLHAVLGALRGPMRDQAMVATLVAGPLMPEGQRAMLQRATHQDPRVELLPFTREMPALLAQADLVIAMGGYNSVYEALGLGRKLLVMPRLRPRLEQLERARRLESLGLLDVLPPDQAKSPEQVAAAIRTALQRPWPDPAHPTIRLDGAARAAGLLCRGSAGVAPARTGSAS